jgi:hypothetical protein
MKKHCTPTHPSVELTADQKSFLDATRRAYVMDPSYTVNVEEIYKLFGWESFKSATSVIRRHSNEFVKDVNYTTRPHETVPKKIVYELNLEGFKTLMRHAHGPAMRSKKAMDYFSDEVTSSMSEEEEEDEDSSYGEDKEEEDAFEDTDAPIVKRRKIGEEAVSRTSRGCPNITEETIAAVMDRLADEAHKVQADNPECKFPVGVSAKTAKALGWADEYRNVICETTKNKTIVENRDYEVGLSENRGCRASPALFSSVR